MKTFSALLVASTLASASAFVVLPQQSSVATSTTSVQMGLFDFFSPEAQKAREEKKRREIEEQERLQKAIMERRKNPELMEEYERKVAIRRELRMSGRDEEAAEVVMYENIEGKTLLDGTEGLK